LSDVRTESYSSEAVRGFDHRTAMEEAARCLLCHDAPCSEGCPAGTDPGKFIRSIRFRNPKGAAETIRENNPLGGVCARVCPYDRLCEEACSRCGIDRPIEIGKLQRYAVEQEEAFGMVGAKVASAAPAGGARARVACVGAGPASIACAAELARAGVRVTVYEREERPGGVLSYGITPTRLPRKVVDHDIAAVRALGVDFECGVCVGIDVSVDDLFDRRDFDAVFLGTGLWAPKIPDIPGARLDNVFAAADFLKRARVNDGSPDAPGKTVIVIGGGDVAMDCAATALLSGAKKVSVWYRRTIAEAPASMAEILYVTELGVGISENFAPASAEKSNDGLLVRFKGRDGVSEAAVACDIVVFAVGQGAEDARAAFAVSTDEKGLVAANPATDREGVFAAGDAVHGGKTVVEAVAKGKEAAAAILAYLNRKGVKQRDC
jgi:dihydropyrimidine dehydrogenase (NAD+) subunit PreT